MENAIVFNQNARFGLGKKGVAGGDAKQRPCFGFTKSGGSEMDANNGQMG
jgi:hypothetical protein